MDEHYYLFELYFWSANSVKNVHDDRRSYESRRNSKKSCSNNGRTRTIEEKNEKTEEMANSRKDNKKYSNDLVPQGVLRYCKDIT